MSVPDADRLLVCCIRIATRRGIRGNGAELTRLMLPLMEGAPAQFWRGLISDPPSRAFFYESMRRLYGFTAREAAAATRVFSAIGFADKSRPRPIRPASTVFSWCEALIPKRVADEYFGDALEQMEGQSAVWISLKIVSTLFWVGLAALRELGSVARMLAR